MMFYIGLHGQKVPDWFQKCEVTPKDAEVKLTFYGIVFIWNKNGGYKCRGMFHPTVMRMRSAKRGVKYHADISGQSPPGGDEDVTINLNPVLHWHYLVGFVAGYLVALPAPY